MASIAFDLQQLYYRTFGTKPKLPGELPAANLGEFKIQGQSNSDLITSLGSNLKTVYEGQEIWMPVRFVGLDYNVFGVTELLLPYMVISISGRKEIIKTPLAQRGGKVKEEYAIDDYTISIKGFLIDKNRVFPEKELIVLEKLFTLGESVRLDNAITNVFLKDGGAVVIEAFDLPEVQGGRTHVKPVNMKLSSDSIFTLELQ